MTTLEDEFKARLIAAFSFEGVFTQEHEDKDSNFIPDLSFAGKGKDGWIEVKYCPETPAKLSSIRHYTRGQELWLRNAGMNGSGYCFLVVGTPDVHAAWRWQDLVLVRDMPFESALNRCFVHGYNVTDLLFVRMLMNRVGSYPAR